jgi:hypothetical protein
MFMYVMVAMALQVQLVQQAPMVYLEHLAQTD